MVHPSFAHLVVAYEASSWLPSHLFALVAESVYPLFEYMYDFGFRIVRVSAHASKVSDASRRRGSLIPDDAHIFCSLSGLARREKLSTHLILYFRRTNTSHTMANATITTLLAILAVAMATGAYGTHPAKSTTACSRYIYVSTLTDG